jgi:hypothetical protein
MIEKWFEHRGCINLEKITEFLEEDTNYKKEYGDWSPQNAKWCLSHGENCKDKGDKHVCPPQPSPPKEPELKDYVNSNEQVCELVDVLEHPLAFRGSYLYRHRDLLFGLQSRLAASLSDRTLD